jgi:predicted nucleic acid-binding protein
MSSGTPEAHPVVVNTGPIFALAGIGHLPLLRSLYTRVYVPEAVAREVLRGDASGAGMAAFSEAVWIECRPVQCAPHPLVIATLDQGEAEVVTLAIELGFRHVLIDETAGRRVAQVLGLSVSGTVGALLRAKREGHLDAVRPLLDELRRQGIWLGKRVYGFAVEEAGES